MFPDLRLQHIQNVEIVGLISGTLQQFLVRKMGKLSEIQVPTSWYTASRTNTHHIVDAKKEMVGCGEFWCWWWGVIHKTMLEST